MVKILFWHEGEYFELHVTQDETRLAGPRSNKTRPDARTVMDVLASTVAGQHRSGSVIAVARGEEDADELVARYEKLHGKLESIERFD